MDDGKDSTGNDGVSSPYFRKPDGVVYIPQPPPQRKKKPTLPISFTTTWDRPTNNNKRVAIHGPRLLCRKKGSIFCFVLGQHIFPVKSNEVLNFILDHKSEEATKKKNAVVGCYPC